MVELIILDMWGTFLTSDKGISPFLRGGFINFLDRYSRIAKVVATDDNSNEKLVQFELLRYFDRIFLGRELKSDPRVRKNLSYVCMSLGYRIYESVFISDGETDRLDARVFDVPFIHVPPFMNSNETFSFDRINLEGKLPMYTDLRSL